MYVKATRTQIKLLLFQWGALLAFGLLLALALNNFMQNVEEYQGTDVVLMYHPMKLLSLSYNMAYSNGGTLILLMQLVPLLICIPAALSLAQEQHSGASVLMASRLGGRTYLLSKVTAVFVVTALVFSLPFLLEIVLNCVSFPLKATGDLANLKIYEPEYIESTKNFLLYPLYRLSPYLYAVVETIRFGATMGLLAAATLTPFLLLQLSTYLSQYFDVHWANYVTLFHGEARNDLVYWAAVAVLLAFVVLGSLYASRKDWLQ